MIRNLACNIDRELISCRSLARCYVATGKDEDAEAALTAEAGLKEVIDQSPKDTKNPAHALQRKHAAARLVLSASGRNG